MSTIHKKVWPLQRCPWLPKDDALYVEYHDAEWGVPVHDDKKIYEFLVLESFQAGLSWRIVLRKRENFRNAFAGFDAEQAARFGTRDITRLMNEAGIIRNRQKIEAAINNAKQFLKVREEFGSFSKYMWSWVGGKPIIHTLRTMKDYPTYIDQAAIWSRDLKKRGFTFLGPTVVYSHMQAVGMVNDHTINCFRRRVLI